MTSSTSYYKIMIKNSFHFTCNILLTSIFVVTIIGLVQFPGISPIYPATNTTNVNPEKGSTLSITNTSQPNDNRIGKTFIISNPPLLTNNINNLTDSQDSKAILIKENLSPIPTKARSTTAAAPSISASMTSKPANSSRCRQILMSLPSGHRPNTKAGPPSSAATATCCGA